MRRRLLLAALCAAASAAPLSAQRVAIDGLVVGEVWKTDAGSRLLARDSGNWAPELRANLWAQVTIVPRLSFVGLGTLEAGTAEPDHFVVRADQFSLRYTTGWGAVEAGKFLLPMGGFGPRRFAHLNPLIGVPDMYPPLYPYGAMVSGRLGKFDWLAAGVSLPAVDTAYSPVPSHYPRPVFGVGFTAGPGTHFGLSVTHGPYLNESTDTLLPTGGSWKDYAQTVVAGEMKFAVGYVDIRAEATWSRYEVPPVPTATEPLIGTGYFIEARGTLSPRWFIAGRYEWFRYPFILPISQFFWVRSTTLQLNGEVGVGYRLTPAALLKMSYRRDYWPGDPPPGVPLPDGYAFAVQASLYGDVLGLFARRY